ncbi:MAG TPA: hypothetical protein VM425_08905 [Myxococcota bacterium]|nr:hypothetical protein [Myxococcota bacterium]
MVRIALWVFFSLAGLPLAAFAGEENRPVDLPWAGDPAEVQKGALSLRAGTQIFSGRSGMLGGFSFEMENKGASGVVLEVVSIELLSARPAPRPWMPSDPKDRKPRIQQKTVRSCWAELNGQIEEIMKEGRGPCKVRIPAGRKLRLMVRFDQQKMKLFMRYWRRGSFRIGKQNLLVTGPLSEISFSGGTVQGLPGKSK